MRYLMFALILSLASPVLAATPEDAKINAVYAQLSKARGAGDVPGMTSAFDPQALLVDPQPGPVISGAELPARLGPMAERLRSDGVQIETTYRIERRSLIGDIALDAGYMRQLMTRPDGKGITRYSRFLVTMKRDASGAGGSSATEACLPSSPPSRESRKSTVSTTTAEGSIALQVAACRFVGIDHRPGDVRTDPV